MIRIELDAGKIREIYTQEKKGEKGRKGRRDSLTKKLNDRITAHINKTPKTDYTENKAAVEIVTKFLEIYFQKDRTNTKTKTDIICDYLFRERKEMEETILAFWECVGNVWAAKLLNEKGVTISFDKKGEDIKNLSKWSGAKQYIASITDTTTNEKRDEREKRIKKVITKELKVFFLYDSGKDIDDYDKFIKEVVEDNDAFKTVKFRYQNDLYVEKTAQVNGEWGALDILAYIFNYGWLTEPSDLLPPNLRHQILSTIDAPVCPYCNRQYVTLFKDKSNNNNGSISQKEDSKTTADLDHFYIKSAYPFLALNAYNFIPSCQICNSRFKGDTDFHYRPHLYPYSKLLGDEITFVLDNPVRMTESTAWRGWEKPGGTKILDIIEIKAHNEEAENSVGTFHLEEVYQSHVDYIYEILWKHVAYNKDRLTSLLDNFKGLFDKNEAKEMIFGQYLSDDKLYKRPLAKLTRDILDDLNQTR